MVHRPYKVRISSATYLQSSVVSLMSESLDHVKDPVSGSAAYEMSISEDMGK